MVSMSSRPSAMRRLFRQGARLAGALGGPWMVVYVRTPGERPDRIQTETLRALADNTSFARDLGAEVVRLEGTDVPETLARFALEHRVTHAVFGRTRDAGWTTRLKGSVLERFFKLAPDVDVLVVGSNDVDG
jgi:two-component system sensor histidine kinase KdpD